MVEWRSPKPQVGGSKPSWPANTYKVNMNSSTNKQNEKILNGSVWLLLAILLALATYCSSHFGLSASVQSIMWIGWFIVSLSLFYCTSHGKVALTFVKESKIEIQKVVWPSRSETVQTTMIVIAMVAVTGFVLWAVDMSMMWVIGKITHLG